jgi:hypothetical protein
MKLKEDQYEELRSIITERVEEMAKNAASWVFDGNTEDATYRRVLKGIEDGDPEIMDALPCVDWSGQWADGPNWNDELRAAILEVLENDEELTEEALKDDDYDDIFNEIAVEHANGAVQTEVERIANLHLH